MDSTNDIPRQANMEMANAFKIAAESLADESERGSVVLAAAWLDESLTAILAAYMKPSEKKEDLLAPGRPLGDFGTKIILADRLRLVAPPLLKSLDMIRRLRNDFAHIASDLNFENQSVKDRVQIIFKDNEDLLLSMGDALLQNGMNLGPAGEKLRIEHMLKLFGAKKLFQYTCAILNAALAVIKFNLKPAEAQFNLED
ncbi:hypothetical protein DM819_21785 [Pseudomonas hunanensis]|uniref:Transcriptional regulator n=1 Tax=Pseudomonas hunanensis TaxID=1247546 RepID=A0ABD6N5A6_9PSED|nr:hypothetical protein [Pseudomonas hunanensis]NWL48424.1 hypothetical protein [Pseudomonas hunanensis]